MNEQKKLTDMTQEELEALFADKTMPDWFDYLPPEEEVQFLSSLELPADENDIQHWLDELTPPEDLQEWLEQLHSQEDTDEESPCCCFSNVDPYMKPEPHLPDNVRHNFRFGEDGKIHVKNISAYWIPELTVTEEISGTIYTVTGSYVGTESFLRKLERIKEAYLNEIDKLERITAKNFTEKAEEEE